MSHDTYELKAEARDRVGKGSARAIRRNGQVPAVIYGEKQAPISITLPYKDIFYKIHGGGFMTTVATIDVGGQKIRVLPKDYQLDPVSDAPVHVDFLRIGAHETVTVQVPVVFTDEDESGYAKQGGVLNVVAHELAVTCDAANIPTEIAISLKGREIGETIHLSDITLPQGVTAASEDDTLTIATVVPARSRRRC